MEEQCNDQRPARKDRSMSDKVAKLERLVGEMLLAQHKLERELTCLREIVPIVMDDTEGDLDFVQYRVREVLQRIPKD
jgi:hypothetical protein